MNKLLTLLSVLLLCLYSCNVEPPESVVTSFQYNGDTLKSKKVVDSEVGYLNPLNLACVNNDYLVVYNYRPDTLFDLYSLPDMKFVNRYGVIGRGPKDFHMVDASMFNPVDGGFQTYSVFRGDMLNVTVDKRGVNIKDRTPMPIEMIMSARCNQFSPDKYFYKSDNNEVEFYVYDTQNNEITSGPDFPTYWANGGLDPSQYFLAFMAMPVMKPSGDRLALFYQYYKRLRIYDNDMNLVTNINLQTKPYEVKYNVTTGMPQTSYYSYPQTTQDAIYVLCTSSLKPYRTELQVWGWDGAPLATYPLDQPCKYMAISEKHGKIYCIDVRNNIVEYEMPKLS